MKVAALYDIHGNKAALAAVIDEVRREGVDVIVVGGDVASGPFPVETLEQLMGLGDRALYVMGNADRALFGEDAAPGKPGVWEARDGWARARLGPRELDFLSCFPPTQTLEIEGLGRTLFCHGTPDSDEAIVTRVTPVCEVEPILSGVDSELIVCGHTHVQFDRRVGERRLVNAGSVGMPYEGRPGAFWALLGPDVAFRRTDYDFESAAAEIRAVGWPEADEAVGDLFEGPPSAEEATSFFEEERKRN